MSRNVPDRRRRGVNREVELRAGRGADRFMDLKQEIVAKLKELRS